MRSDNSGRRERTRPGFYFMFCVWQSSVRGCRFSVMFVYFVIKMCLNVRRFPPPSSRTYQLHYSEHLHTQVGYDDVLQSDRGPDEDDEHPDDLP